MRPKHIKTCYIYIYVYIYTPNSFYRKERRRKRNTWVANNKNPNLATRRSSILLFGIPFTVPPKHVAYFQKLQKQRKSLAIPKHTQKTNILFFSFTHALQTKSHQKHSISNRKYSLSNLSLKFNLNSISYWNLSKTHF